jgi:hypothetical protein
VQNPFRIGQLGEVEQSDIEGVPNKQHDKALKLTPGD